MYSQLAIYFELIKPPLPQVCTHYNIRGPVFHLPDIRHFFSEQTIRYCLIKRFNPEKSRMDIIHNSPLYNFKINIKNEMINTYSAVCTIDECYVCSRLH